MSRAAFNKIAAGLREAIAVAQGDDIPARIECWGAFAPSRQSPETKKERALAGTPLRLVTRSLRSGHSLHVPNHEAGPAQDAVNQRQDFVRRHRV